MAVWSTQPLVKMSTSDVPGGKGGRCVRLTAYHHIVPMSRNLVALTLLDPSGPAWPLMGVLYLYLYVNYLRCSKTEFKRHTLYICVFDLFCREKKNLIVYSLH
jgi:hypothetical protein